MSDVKNDFVEKTVTMKVRKGHGPWWQAMIPKEDGTQTLLIFRTVKSFREMPGERSNPFGE